ncbi:MAG: polysaccharide biosynthesis C-terminal domain-containing protein [Fibrobacter sp.]|jgi:O-antigen/teichoic acid export membrane protein|nr:polysaccharide biosynthesis C-terminal domain-containing protein [Fibrobacter sp.]
MSRKTKLILNTGASFFYQIVIVLCGFILPQMIINYYGSSANGLIASITNFLAFFALTEMGVGAVVRASLYKPLANKDNLEISKILISSKRFFSKIGLFLVVYSIVLIAIFPFVSDTDYDFLSTSILIIAIAFCSVSQYLFGVVYEQLLNAAQRSYATLIISSFTIIASTVISAIMIKTGFSLQAVKVVAAFVFLARPLLLKIYARKKFAIDFSVHYTGEPIKQKWNGVAQHVATFVLKHSDFVVLTFFSNLKNVSIYYVYNLISNGLHSLVSIASNGFYSLIGDMYAKKEEQKLKDLFASFEFGIHVLVVVIYSCAFLLAIPFIKLYTINVHDANYCIPAFAYVFFIASMFFCLRTPYYIVVQSVGHFKETQNSAIIEAVLNVLFSLILVFKYDLLGVAIGSCVAMVYRTLYLVFYLSKRVLHISITKFFFRMFIDFISLVACIFLCDSIVSEVNDYMSFVLLGLKVFVICFFTVSIINILFYLKKMNRFLQILSKRGV